MKYYEILKDMQPERKAKEQDRDNLLKKEISLKTEVLVVKYISFQASLRLRKGAGETITNKVNF